MSVVKVALFVATAIGGYAVYVVIYGLFVCPTRHLPGPFITRFSQIPHLLLVFGGTHCIDIRKLHDRYGPVVRLTPQLVAVVHPEAALQAFAGQNESKLIWDKDPANCRAVRGGLNVDNVLSISGAKESQRMRRLVGAPFAKKFLLDQEHLFKDCTKRMIQRISKLCEDDPRVDVLVEYKNYALDILSTPLVSF
jgi:cytochrome P450